MKRPRLNGLQSSNAVVSTFSVAHGSMPPRSAAEREY
jgi:hypothetical protein